MKKQYSFLMLLFIAPYSTVLLGSNPNAQEPLKKWLQRQEEDRAKDSFNQMVQAFKDKKLCESNTTITTRSGDFVKHRIIFMSNKDMIKSEFSPEKLLQSQEEFVRCWIRLQQDDAKQGDSCEVLGIKATLQSIAFQPHEQWLEEYSKKQK